MQTIFTTALLGLLFFSNQSGVAANAPAHPAALHVAATGYNAVPEQTDNEPFITASGAYADPDMIVARSADLADALPFGTVIQIVPTDATSSPQCGIGLVSDFMGLRVVADSMHPRKHNQIDILFHSDDYVKVNGKMVNPAIALGVCKDVEVRIVGHVGVNDMPRNQAELVQKIGHASIARNN